MDNNVKKNDMIHSIINTVKPVSTGLVKNVTNMGNESFDFNSPNTNTSVEQLEASIMNSITQLAAANENISNSLDGNKMAIIKEAVKNTYVNAYNAKRFNDHLDRIMTQRAPVGEGFSSVSTENVNFSSSQITNNELKTYVINSMSSGNEAWDGQSFETTLTYNIALNYTATEQDEFAKAFFPIIPIKASDAFFEITSNQIFIMNNEPVHDINGNPSRAQFKRKSVIKSALDPNVWNTNRNLLIPVVRADSEKYFLLDYKTTNSRSGVTVETAPLIVDTSIGLLGISHDDQLAAKGTPDFTDAVDRDLVLEDIYLEISTKDGTKKSVFKFNVSFDRSSRFLPSIQGDYEKQLDLRFETDALYLDVGADKDASGQTAEVLEELAGTLNNYKLRLSVSAGGSIITNVGDIKVSNLGNGSIVELYDEKGELVPETDTKYEYLLNTIGDIKIIGYTLIAYRTNSNLRVQGKILTSDTSKRFYTVPFHTAVTVTGPVTNAFGDDNDINRLASCMNIGNLAIRHDAVYQVQRYADVLRSITRRTIGKMKPKLDTIAEHYVDLYYKYSTINLPTLVDGVSSSNRLSDIRAALLNNIFQDVSVMGLESKFYNAFDAFFPGDRKKLHVIVGTDPIIGAYLRGGGSGEDLKFDKDKYLDIVVSYNESMYGKIYITFTVYDTLEGGKHIPHPLAFGWCPWAPATVVDINRTLNGATRKDLFSFLRYANITNLPIMLEYDVTGIEEVLGKIQVYTKEFSNETAVLPGPGGTTVNNTPLIPGGNVDGD